MYTKGHFVTFTKCYNIVRTRLNIQNTATVMQEIGKKAGRSRRTFTHLYIWKIHVECRIALESFGTNDYFRTACESLVSWVVQYINCDVHGFVELCFFSVSVIQSLSIHLFPHIFQGHFTCTLSTIRLLQRSEETLNDLDKIGHCQTTTNHNKARTECKFVGFIVQSHVYHLRILW